MKKPEEMTEEEINAIMPVIIDIAKIFQELLQYLMKQVFEPILDILADIPIQELMDHDKTNPD